MKVFQTSSLRPEPGVREAQITRTVSSLSGTVGCEDWVSAFMCNERATLLKFGFRQIRSTKKSENSFQIIIGQ